MREVRSNSTLENIILARDLNAILNQAKKRGGYMVRDPIRKQVDELILDWEVSEVIPSKGKFTWTNKRMGPWHIAARLDKFMIQESFLLLGFNPSSKILPFGGSYHKPILLEVKKEQNLSLICFRFSPLWATHKDFLGLLIESWSALVSRSPFYIWEEKLRRV